jgi:hypothetical protein
MIDFVRLLRLSSALSGAIALVMTCTAATAWAQHPTLGDVARKEQERRKTLPAAAKVYTNKDLPKSALKPEGAPAGQSGEPSAGAPAGEAAAEPAGEAAASPSNEQKDEPKAGGDGEEAWRKRMVDAREQLRRSEMFAQALQTRVNSLTSDVLSRDDYAQKARLSRERKEAIDELSRVRQEIERGKKQIVDLEEEARRAGVPPGWLR